MRQLLIRTIQHVARLIRRPIRWRRIVFGSSAVLVLGIVVFSIPSVAHAELDGVWGTLLGAGNVIASLLAEFTLFFVQLVIAFTFFALKFFITLAGYNGFSNAPIVNIGWTLVRDVANMFFIVALLVIAFATILGREDYALKKTLGKLVLMAILVNFSKLIAQLIIDVAHVVTMTFLNAVSAIAGGNLIQLFKFDQMRQLVADNAANAGGGGREDIGFELLLAAGASLMLAVVAFVTILVYMVIMLWRVVTLWTLIVISPLAFALSALPGTAHVGKEWWSQFTNNVISAPIMVFFLWLAFATIGNGAVLQQITSNNSLNSVETNQFQDAEQSATIGRATTWENMAAFAVAVAFLFAGIEQVQKLGVRGGEQLGKIEGIGKKAALIGSGALLAGYAVKNAPLVGAKSWERRGKTIKARASRGTSIIASKWDNKMGDSTFGSFFKTGRYKEKKVRAWEEAAENQKEIYEDQVSTSKTAAGEAKLQTRAEKEAYQGRGKEKLARKMEAERMRLMTGKKHDVDENDNVVMKTGEAEKSLSNRQSAKSKEFRGLINTAYQERRKAAIMGGRNQDIVATEERGEIPRFESAALARVNKEYEEPFESQSFDAHVGQAARLAGLDTAQSQNQLIGLTQVASKKGASRSMAVINSALAKKGDTKIRSSEDLQAQTDAIKKILGDTPNPAQMAGLADAFSAAAAGGDATRAGLITETIDKDGRSVYEWTTKVDVEEKDLTKFETETLSEKGNERWQEKFKGATSKVEKENVYRDYQYSDGQQQFISRFVTPGKLTGANSLVSNGADGSQILNDRDADNLIGGLGSARRGQFIPSGVRDDLREMMLKGGKENFEYRKKVFDGLSDDARSALEIDDLGKPNGIFAASADTSNSQSPAGGAAGSASAAPTTRAGSTVPPTAPSAPVMQKLENKIDTLLNEVKKAEPSFNKDAGARQAFASIAQKIKRLSTNTGVTSVDSANKSEIEALEKLSQAVEHFADVESELTSLNNRLMAAKNKGNSPTVIKAIEKLIKDLENSLGDDL